MFRIQTLLNQIGKYDHLSNYGLSIWWAPIDTHLRQSEHDVRSEHYPAFVPRLSSSHLFLQTIPCQVHSHSNSINPKSQLSLYWLPSNYHLTLPLFFKVTVFIWLSFYSISTAAGSLEYGHLWYYRMIS